MLMWHLVDTDVDHSNILVHSPSFRLSVNPSLTCDNQRTSWKETILKIDSNTPTSKSNTYRRSLIKTGLIFLHTEKGVTYPLRASGGNITELKLR